MGERRPASIRRHKAAGQFVEASACLAKAAVKPVGASMFGGMEVPFVDHSRGLFEGALSQCRHLEDEPARGAGGGDQRCIVRLFVEMIKDGGAVDQHLAIVEDEGRDTGQGADLPDCRRIAKDRAGVAGEGYAVVMQRDCDAAGDGAVILADEDNGESP